MEYCLTDKINEAIRRAALGASDSTGGSAGENGSEEGADEDHGVVEYTQIVSLVEQVIGSRLPAELHRRLAASAEGYATNGVVGLSELKQIMADTLSQTTHWGNLKLDTAGYVGIDTLQEQIRKKVVKRGFEFNIIVVGRSGLGKSTLVNTLFKANVSRKSCTKDGHVIIPPTTQVKSVSHVIEEKGIRLRLTITDTPGFGDQINNDNCWVPIIDYINDQYAKYLVEEQNIHRKRHIPDTRIHCCLYFIQPSGHSLKPLDIELMRRLDRCTNVVPVIAKADTLTIEERTMFKKRIKDDLATNGIQIYPIKEYDEDSEDKLINNRIRDLVPFAVVGSDHQHQVNGRTVLGRKTQWGLVEVENRSHCEFADLRDMLVRTHMQDLVDITSCIHYENFRRQHLDSHNRDESNAI